MKLVRSCEVDIGTAASSITFLESGQVALGDARGRVTFVDPASGQYHRSFPPPEPEFYDGDEEENVPAGEPLGAPLVTPDGETAVVLYSLGALVVDLPTGAVRHRLARDEEYGDEEEELVGLPWTGVLGPARRRVAILYAHPDDGISTIFWDLQSGSRAGALQGEQLNCVAQMPDGRHWVVADVDGSLARYDIETQQLVRHVQPAPITARERLFLSIARPERELQWEAVTSAMVADAAVSRLLTLRKNGALVVVDAATGAILREDYPDTPAAWSTLDTRRLLAFSPDGTAFLLPEQTDVTLVDVATGDIRWRWGAAGRVTRCSFLPAAGLVLTVAEERTIQLWQEGHDLPVAAWTTGANILTWALSTEGRLVTAQSDGRCLVLQLTPYQATRTIDSLQPPRAHDGLPV